MHSRNTRRLKPNIQGIFCLFCLLLTCGLAACGGEPAKKKDDGAEPELPEITAKVPAAAEKSEPLLPYPEIPLCVDGEVACSAYLKDDGAYVPLGALCKAFGMTLSIKENSAESMNAIISAITETELCAQRGNQYMTADGRYIYLPNDWERSDNELLFPQDAIQKIFGTELVRSGNEFRMSSENVKLISGGREYYDLYFPYEDVYWLVHIIYAEAWQQPLAGQIGVGNVVFNRVASELFPNSVMEVVYDIEHTVQFEPVSNGSIKAEPDETAYIAAYLCLEGCNTVGDSLYFMNPDCGSTWFDNNLEMTVKIGNHNFYK